jgi:hypothetical protein
MKGTEKKYTGPALVIGIVALATLGAGLTWRNYLADRPSAIRAELLDANTAQADFSPGDAARIRPGSKAIISQNGQRSTGFVATQSGTSFHLTLLQPFNEVPPGTACQVTVDLSIPPELLRDSPPARVQPLP